MKLIKNCCLFSIKPDFAGFFLPHLVPIEVMGYERSNTYADDKSDNGRKKYFNKINNHTFSITYIRKIEQKMFSNLKILRQIYNYLTFSFIMIQFGKVADLSKRCVCSQTN